MASYVTALTIAGSDPSGGAGIQADLKTFSALGCYGLSVITALTAQNTQGVQGIEYVSEQFVEKQLKSVFDDIEVGVIKTGMLHNSKIITVIANFLKNKCCPLLVDPVITAKDGSILLEDSAIFTLQEKLLPLATLITPNIPEAEVLLQCSIKNYEDMEKACKSLATLGPKAVLLKGGHLMSTESNDCFYDAISQEISWFKAPRINTLNTHGTGCTLSAAITACLAKGFPLERAIGEAKKYLSAALKAGAELTLGHGHGPVYHFYPKE